MGRKKTGLSILTHSRVPLYAVVLFVIAAAAAVLFLIQKFREVVYDYRLTLPREPAAEEVRFEFGSWLALQDADFFNEVREKFIEEKGAFIEANLSTMRLRLFDHGTTTLDVEILTKGKEGSWWETPAGLYKVESKRENHFSAFANVYLPWSLPFQGNFFIHGWPYRPDGTPVQSSYSGGCIRLGTEDAKALFDRVAPGTPVLVYEKDFEHDTVHYAPIAPPLAAANFFTADLKSNFVFAEAASEKVAPVASLAKFMTALVAVEHVNIEKEITVQPAMLVDTSKPRLKVGESYSLYDLLFPLLLESSNEAAEAIARFLGRERFIRLMNEKAKAIGMTRTRFVDPSGSGGDNASTARDLFELARYLYNNRSFVLQISSGNLARSVYGPPRFRDLRNFNVFGADPDFLGGKVGKSSMAKETLLAVFMLPHGAEIRPVAFVVLGSPNVAEDAEALVSWTRKTYFKEE